MPFYEYVCTQCGAATELLQKVSDPPATTCPHCHAEALSKQISAAGFRLKGGGWYETDFKSDGQRNLVKDGNGAPAEAKAADAGHTCGAGCAHGAKPPAAAEPKAEAKTETKPAPPAASPAATGAA